MVRLPLQGLHYLFCRCPFCRRLLAGLYHLLGGGLLLCRQLGVGLLLQLGRPGCRRQGVHGLALALQGCVDLRHLAAELTLRLRGVGRVDAVALHLVGGAGQGGSPGLLGLGRPLRLFGGGLQGLLLLLGHGLDLRQLIRQGGLLVLGFFSGFGRVLYRLALTLEQLGQGVQLEKLFPCVLQALVCRGEVLVRPLPALRRCLLFGHHIGQGADDLGQLAQGLLRVVPRPDP